MFKLNEEKEFVKIQRKETLVFIIFILSGLVVAGIRAVYFYWFVVHHSENVIVDIMAVTEMITMILISLIVVSLLYQLHSNFKREYEMNYRNVLFFFIVETSILALFIIGNFVDDSLNHTFGKIKWAIIQLGIYPIL
jgi:hypothetical protein